MIALWLLACGLGSGDTAPTPLGGPGALGVHVGLDGPPKAGGGNLLVQVSYDPDGEVAIPTPVAQGVTFEEDGPPKVERIGGHEVLSQRYVFTAPKGSYEIAPLHVTWTAKDGTQATTDSAAVFVDLGVKPPRPGEITDIVEPERIRVFPWVATSAVAAVCAAGLWFAFRPRRVAVPVGPPPVPPDVVALTAWDAVRADATLPLEAKAVRLAELFRTYVEAVLGFEATARTTPEILAHLESLPHLPGGNGPRAKRILRATDRVKFAEERPGAGRDEAVAEWLAELDADLRAFVESTRPVGLSKAPGKRA